MSSYLSTRKGNRQQTFLMHFPHAHRSKFFTTYVSGNWKLIYFYPVGNNKVAGKRHVELYNLAADPDESNNLSDSKPEMTQRLLKEMITRLDDAGAQYMVDRDTGSELRPEM